jgi:hypothetical protein
MTANQYLQDNINIIAAIYRRALENGAKSPVILAADRTSMLGKMILANVPGMNTHEGNNVVLALDPSDPGSKHIIDLIVKTEGFTFKRTRPNSFHVFAIAPDSSVAHAVIDDLGDQPPKSRMP